MSVSIIQADQKPFELLWFDVNDPLIPCGPVKTMLLKSLEPEGEAVVVPVQNFDHVALPIAKHK
jgi:hypothetical protein